MLLRSVSITCLLGLSAAAQADDPRPTKKPVIGFAIAGLIDVDNDGRSDRRVLKKLIFSNGDTFDAELGGDREIQGRLLPTTRYLLVGAPPAPTRMGAAQRYADLIEQARARGIEVVRPNDMLRFGSVTPGKAAAPVFRARAPLRDAY